MVFQLVKFHEAAWKTVEVHQKPADLDLHSEEDINLGNSISVKVAQVSGTDPESFVWLVGVRGKRLKI